MSEILENKEQETEYIDLIRTKECLTADEVLVAPPWSYLRKGDKILTEPLSETSYGLGMTCETVETSITIQKGGEFHEFLKAMGTTFNKVYGRVSVSLFEVEEDKEKKK